MKDIRSFREKMLHKNHSSRVDTLELKVLIIKKIGRVKAEKYFDCLKRFFSFKLSKREFDRFCSRTVGRENIALHNRFIGSIIKNSCLAEVPPFRARNGEASISNANIINGQRNSLQSLYGDAFPPSPRRSRSSFNRDRKVRDRSSQLGVNGEIEDFMNPRVQEQQSVSLGSRPPNEVVSVEEGEEVEQMAESPFVQSRSPVSAPFGISVANGGSRKALSNGYFGNFKYETCQKKGELPDTWSLRTRLEQKLETEGINVSLDCVNLLNNGLDTFLKRLIGPCLGLAQSKSHHAVYASLVDFQVAMELKPQLLGEDWAIQLEKVCSRAFEE